MNFLINVLLLFVIALLKETEESPLKAALTYGILKFILEFIFMFTKSGISLDYLFFSCLAAFFIVYGLFRFMEKVYGPMGFVVFWGVSFFMLWL